MLALLSVKDGVYGALILALLVGFGVFVHHERQEGAAREVASLQKSSAELQAKAAVQVKQVATAYAASAATITENLHAQVQAASAQHDSDAQRLREYDAYRRQHPALASTAAAAGPQAAGDGSADGTDRELASLELVALGLATAGRQAQTALSACMAERDSVTGK